MFTGIIEEVGGIRALRRGYQGAGMVIAAERISGSLKTGDSVSVNGVCLTVTRQDDRTFSCDLSAETLARSSFQRAREGTPVNLERPVMVGGRLGGHIVQGHVDGVGRLVESVASGDGQVTEISYPRELARYLVHKGSVAVDGISLTIAELGAGSFKVAVIPHTWQSTNLRSLPPGSPVNLEVDPLGKYFERFFQLGLVHGRPDESKWSALLGE